MTRKIGKPSKEFETANHAVDTFKDCMIKRFGKQNMLSLNLVLFEEWRKFVISNALMIIPNKKLTEKLSARPIVE